MYYEKNNNDDQCEHEMCSCTVDDDSSYCSDSCERAADQDSTEDKCKCGHSSCS